MSRAVFRRSLLLLCLVTFLGSTLSGQSTTRKTTRKPPAKAAAPKPEAVSKPAPTDIRIRTRYTSGAQISENTTYMKGTRQRVEFPGVVTIEQCDLGRTLLVNPAAKTYLVNEHAKASPAVADGATPATDAARSVAPKVGRPKGGVVTVTTTLTDTGEHKVMFGKEARHVTTAMTRQASPSACDKTAIAVEVDAWYLDLPGVAQCPIASWSPAAPAAGSDACVDQVETHTTGEAKLGFPVAMTTTTKTGEGDKQEIVTSAMEVTELEVTELDAALFDVPPGYTEVHSNAELMAGFQNGGLGNALMGSTADGTSTAAPKSAGRVRIGVLEPVDRSSHKLPTRELREELAGDFSKAPFEAVTLAGTSVADGQADAARMQCDYLLYTEVGDIKTSKPGRVGGMLKKVSRDGPPQDVHEVRLDYRLYPAGAAPTAPPAFADSIKATSGGGFSLHSALRLAMFAGSLYLRFTGLGLLNPMLMSNFGVGLGPLAGTGLFDPRMNAMSSLSQLFTSNGVDAARTAAGAVAMPGAAEAGPDPEAVIRQTVDTALVNEAKGAIEQLKKNRKQ